MHGQRVSQLRTLLPYCNKAECNQPSPREAAHKAWGECVGIMQLKHLGALGTTLLPFHHSAHPLGGCVLMMLRQMFDTDTVIFHSLLNRAEVLYSQCSFL